MDGARAVARPLVVLPHRRHLVLARRGDGVDDVLGADEELLAQHGAALRAERRWLAPALVLLSLALAGRVVSLLAGGWDLMSLPPMVLEALLILILAFGWRGLRPA